MLNLKVTVKESLDEKNQFVYEYFYLQLEHSLVSLSKWESKYEKPFLSNDTKEPEDLLNYVECMILTPDFPPDILFKMTEDNFKEIYEYIDKKMTATWFNIHGGSNPSAQTITAELIYYWITTCGIDWQVQHWHLNKLLTLIQVHNAKAEKPKKMGRSEVLANQKELNERRKAQLGTRG